MVSLRVTEVSHTEKEVLKASFGIKNLLPINQAYNKRMKVVSGLVLQAIKGNFAAIVGEKRGSRPDSGRLGWAISLMLLVLMRAPAVFVAISYCRQCLSCTAHF